MMINSGLLKQIGWPWRLLFEKERHGYLIRLMRRYGSEVAYIAIGLRGLECEIEFPSDWREEKRAWVRISLGVVLFAFSFPWSKVVPDDGQCSGPTYGFQFFEEYLWIKYGKEHARVGTSKCITITMPWAWKHRKHVIETEPEIHPYRYILKNGTVQERTATIQVETRLWTRYWLPWRLFRRSIVVQFNKEVGERAGSWKGGVIGCGYDMNALEQAMPQYWALECLRRMERERRF